MGTLILAPPCNHNQHPKPVGFPRSQKTFSEACLVHPEKPPYVSLLKTSWFWRHKSTSDTLGWGSTLSLQDDRKQKRSKKRDCPLLPFAASRACEGFEESFICLSPCLSSTSTAQVLVPGSSMFLIPGLKASRSQKTANLPDIWTSHLSLLFSFSFFLLFKRQSCTSAKPRSWGTEAALSV